MQATCIHLFIFWEFMFLNGLRTQRVHELSIEQLERWYGMSMRPLILISVLFLLAFIVITNIEAILSFLLNLLSLIFTGLLIIAAICLIIYLINLKIKDYVASSVYVVLSAVFLYLFINYRTAQIWILVLISLSLIVYLIYRYREALKKAAEQLYFILVFRLGQEIVNLAKNLYIFSKMKLINRF